jgi:DNA-binding CsgD family transcriptional regulator/PAS domain-containing protein
MSMPPSHPRSLQELLLRTHESETVRGVQEAYIGLVDSVLPARGHGIYHLDEGSQPATVRTIGVSDAFLARYEQEGRAIDPLLGHLGSRREAIRSSAWRPTAWRAHPFYEVIATGGLHHILQAPLTVDGELRGTLNVARTPRDRPFSAAEQERAALVARHVSVALARAEAYERVERRSTLLERALDLLRIPLLATALDGTVLFRNHAAAELLEAYGAGPSSTGLGSALQRSRELLARGDRRVVTTAVEVAEGDVPLGLDARARRRPGARLAVRSTLLAGRTDTIVSFVHETPAAAPVQSPLLSPREREVVELVARGLSNREIAELASISRNTVKQHLKRVFRKAGVGSRAELAAAVGREQSAGGPFREGAREYPPG